MGFFPLSKRRKINEFQNHYPVWNHLLVDIIAKPSNVQDKIRKPSQTGGICRTSGLKLSSLPAVAKRHIEANPWPRHYYFYRSIRGTVVVRWTAGQQVEFRGMIHDIHLISHGFPRPSIALQCRIVAKIQFTHEIYVYYFTIDFIMSTWLHGKVMVTTTAHQGLLSKPIRGLKLL